MEYKRNPTAVNKQRAAGLKWVLVTSYGYLRFREFKLGIGSSHMAVGAYARKTLLEAMHLAEESGFEVVHGIIDSLYIKKKDKSPLGDEDVKAFCELLYQHTGIPAVFDGIFKWLVFLPSIQDKERPVPARYYGVFKNGEIKARGLEVRQKNPPLVVREFQQAILELLAECDTKEQIIAKIPACGELLHRTIHKLPALGPRHLACAVKLSRSEYKHNIPQKAIVQELRKNGIAVFPGQTVHYVFQRNRVVLPEHYRGPPDVERYRQMLVRALYIVLQPFGATKDGIIAMAGCERQVRLGEFDSAYVLKSPYISAHRAQNPRPALTRSSFLLPIEDNVYY